MFRRRDKWTPDLLKEHFDGRLDKADDALIRALDGFPQEYETKLDAQHLAESLNMIRQDHVQRREIEELKDQLRISAEDVRKRLDEQTGRRTATYALITVVVMLFVFAGGFIWHGQLTRGEVNQQIQIAAPWLRDRPAIEQRISELERNDLLLQNQLSKLNDKLTFLCKQEAKDNKEAHVIPC